MHIKCTLFEPIKTLKCEDKPFPCVIYCHCNTGGRVEAYQHLKPLISRGIGLFALDFAGSGLSEGEYVSLGKFEVEDVKISVEYLRNCGKVLLKFLDFRHQRKWKNLTLHRQFYM